MNLSPTDHLAGERDRRLWVQDKFASAFVECPACDEGEECRWCLGTRKVTPPTIGQIEADELSPQEEQP